MGLKLTMAPALVALGSLVALGVARTQITLRAALAFLAGAVLGYLAVAGYWCWQLWERFGNPIFPFANQIFRSPYLPAEAIRDSRWVAEESLDYLSPPFDMALGMTERLQEIPFRDAPLSPRPPGGPGVGGAAAGAAGGRRCLQASGACWSTSWSATPCGGSPSTTTATPPSSSSWPRSCWWS